MSDQLPPESAAPAGETFDETKARVELEEAEFDRYVGSDESLPSLSDQLTIKRDTLKRMQNTRYSLREQYRNARYADETPENLENFKRQIVGWGRAIARYESEIRDLEWRLGLVDAIETSVSHSPTPPSVR